VGRPRRHYRKGAQGCWARGADFAQGRGARGADQSPRAPLPTLRLEIDELPEHLRRFPSARHPSAACLEAELHATVRLWPDRRATQHVQVLHVSPESIKSRLHSASKLSAASAMQIHCRITLAPAVGPGRRPGAAVLRSRLETQSQPRIRPSPTAISIGRTDTQLAECVASARCLGHVGLGHPGRGGPGPTPRTHHSRRATEIPPSNRGCRGSSRRRRAVSRDRPAQRGGDAPVGGAGRLGSARLAPRGGAHPLSSVRPVTPASPVPCGRLRRGSRRPVTPRRYQAPERCRLRERGAEDVLRLGGRNLFQFSSR
jgi:hypothetical protein